MPSRPRLPQLPGRFPITQRPQPTRTPRIDLPEFPAWWPGTLPEWLAYKWLLERGMREGPGRDFVYQKNIGGGRRTFFGQVVDFIFPGRSLVWRIQGWFWHYGNGPETTAFDLVNRIDLENRAYRVVDIMDIDILDQGRRDWVLRNALQGIELVSLRLPLGKPGQQPRHYG